VQFNFTPQMVTWLFSSIQKLIIYTLLAHALRQIWFLSITIALQHLCLFKIFF
jgi:hypothetical protein